MSTNDRRRSTDEYRSSRSSSAGRRTSSSGSRSQGSRGSGYRSTGSRGRKKKGGDKSILMMVLVLAVLLLVAAALTLGRRGGSGSSDKTSSQAEETQIVSTEPEIKVDDDIYVDFSALGGTGDHTVNLKGLSHEEAARKIRDSYSWSMRVTNSNPHLDRFVMPSIQDKVDAASETGADAGGTVYEVTVDDPLANVTIRPTKEAFDVPDQIAPVIDAFLQKIYEDVESGNLPEHKEKASGETGEGHEADYTLRLPDFTDVAKDYATQLAAVWEEKPKNGDITSYDTENDKFVFGGFEDGYVFDIDRISRDLADAMNGGNYGAQIAAAGAVAPADSGSVKEKYKTIGTFTTNTTANEVRNKNIRLAAKEVNGTILRPGEEFSFNGTVGERTEAKGFGPAGAYNNGEVVQEVGGGVCQVSSTLFNAVFRAGLTTTYRRSHTFEPSYVTPGMDATVSWGGPDYRFVNNSDHAIGIKASYYNRTCTVSIYGVPVLPDGVSWTMESTKIKDLPLDEPQIITEGTPSAGTTGSVWQVYKIIKQEGAETKRVEDHQTRYYGHRPTMLDPSLTTEASTDESSEAETVDEPSAAEVDMPGAVGPAGEGPAGPGGGTVPSTKSPVKHEPDASASGPGAIYNETTASAPPQAQAPGDEEDPDDENEGPGPVDSGSGDTSEVSAPGAAPAAAEPAAEPAAPGGDDSISEVSMPTSADTGDDSGSAGPAGPGQ